MRARAHDVDDVKGVALGGFLAQLQLGPRLRQPDQRLQLPHSDRRAVRCVEPVV